MSEAREKIFALADMHIGRHGGWHCSCLVCGCGCCLICDCECENPRTGLSVDNFDCDERPARHLPEQAVASGGSESKAVHPNSILTTERAERFAASISIGPSASPLFGTLRHRSVTPLRNESGGPAGWDMSWIYVKADVDRGPFPFTIHAYVPRGQRVGRAAEVVLDAFRRFLDHELREGFMIDGERVFDPHHLDKLESADG